jgi:hypothetical protein
LRDSQVFQASAYLYAPWRHWAPQDRIIAVEIYQPACYSFFLACESFRKKFEIATDEVGNFIKQDEKKGVLREASREGDKFIISCGWFFNAITIYIMYPFFLRLVQEGWHLL